MAFINCSLTTDLTPSSRYWCRPWITSGGASLATNGEVFNWSGNDGIGDLSGTITAPATIRMYDPQVSLTLAVPASGSDTYNGHNYDLAFWLRCNEGDLTTTVIPKGSTYVTPDVGPYYQLYVPIWVHTDWAVYFNLNYTDAPSNPPDLAVTRGAAYGTLPTPTRENFTFVGWFTAETGGTQVTAATICTASENHTLYAHWTELPTSLAFLNPTGGIINGNYYVRCRQGSAYGTLPTPTKTGYSFVGWFTAETGGTQVTAATICTASENHTLYAHWTGAVTRTLTYNANGGSVSPTSASVTNGAALGSLPTPTRTGYTFAGWFKSTVGTDQVTAATIMPDDDLTIYAHWTGRAITITFDANGGSVTETSRSLTVGQQLGPLPLPTKSGSVFAGWFTEASGGTQFRNTSTPRASRTLYAHWRTPNRVTWWGVSFG